MPSTNEGILLVVGAIFLLIGLLGGGVEIAAAKIPSVGKYPRIFSVGVGVILMGIAIIRLIFPPLSPQPTADLTKVETPTPPPTSITVVSTETPVPPTNTPAPPTDIPIPPTNTPVPESTNTPEPRNTPQPPTSTPKPANTPKPTNTPLPPTPTPTPCYGNCWKYDNSARTMTWTRPADETEDIWQPSGEALQKIRDGYTAIFDTSVPGEIFACVLMVNGETVKNSCDGVLYQVPLGSYRVTSANRDVGGFRWCPEKRQWDCK